MRGAYIRPQIILSRLALFAVHHVLCESFAPESIFQSKLVFVRSVKVFFGDVLYKQLVFVIVVVVVVVVVVVAVFVVVVVAVAVTVSVPLSVFHYLKYPNAI